MRIAICDDVQPMLDFLEREIKSKFAEKGLDAKIYSYTNGRDFLRDHQNNPFDVVFLDIVMPDMNGFDVKTDKSYKFKDIHYIHYHRSRSSY